MAAPIAPTSVTTEQGRIQEMVRQAHWNDNRITETELAQIVDSIATDGVTPEELVAAQTLLLEARDALPRLVKAKAEAEAASLRLRQRAERGEEISKEEVVATELRLIEAYDAELEGRHQIPAYQEITNRLAQIYARTAPQSAR